MPTGRENGSYGGIGSVCKLFATNGGKIVAGVEGKGHWDENREKEEAGEGCQEAGLEENERDCVQQERNLKDRGSGCGDGTGAGMEARVLFPSRENNAAGTGTLTLVVLDVGNMKTVRASRREVPQKTCRRSRASVETALNTNFVVSSAHMPVSAETWCWRDEEQT